MYCCKVQIFYKRLLAVGEQSDFAQLPGTEIEKMVKLGMIEKTPPIPKVGEMKTPPSPLKDGELDSTPPSPLKDGELEDGELDRGEIFIIKKGERFLGLSNDRASKAEILEAVDNEHTIGQMEHWQWIQRIDESS